MNFKLFGNEPALVIGFINAGITVAGTLGWSLLGQDQAALWILLVNGVSAAAMAWTTRPLVPGVYTYVIATGAALGVSYGFSLPGETLNAINLAVVPLLALLTRGQVSPIETAATSTTKEPTPEAAAVNAKTPETPEG